jgi:transglutaminase-like putative cysteine protease
MFRGTVALLASLAFFAAASAESSHLGIYMNGARIGDSLYSDTTEVVGGKSLKRGDSSTKMNMGMLGGSMTIEMTATSWSEPGTGRPVRMTFVTKSGGRTDTVDATFGAKYATVTMESGGPRQTKQLLIPTDGPIVDDPMPMVLQGKLNSKRSFYELRPDTLTFSKDQAVNMGPKTISIGEKKYEATLIDIIDSMATMHVYVSSDGQLVKAEGPLGIEFIPDSIGVPAASNTPGTDLAFASSIKPDRKIDNPRYLTRLKFVMNAPGADKLPNDSHQTVTKTAEGWEVTVHPVANNSPGATIAEAAKQQPQWLKNDSYIPSDSKRFKDLAAKIVGKEKRVQGAARAVQLWVQGRMQPNLGIGVLRDANEILSSKEGVCRDYAILTATLLRAAGVPARLCSGLVTWDGTFYYHAWVEAWNGKNWIGVDSTTPDAQMSAGHVKLSDGSIATAFQFPVLDKVSIKVEEAVSR